ncbi:MAG: murein hydrolase activator EnvC family protein [Bacteroidota bacterium]
MKKYIVKIFLCFLFFLPGGILFGQSIGELRKEREQLLEEISRTSRMIEEKEENRQDNVRELNLIEKEIDARERLINNFRDEIDQLDRQIEVNQMLVNDLEDDIQQLKKEYSKILRDSYKKKDDLNELMFLFSASDFNEAYQRYRLLKEYSRYRQRQGEILVESQKKVQSLLKEIQQQREEKEAVLTERENELHRLENNHDRKSRLVQRLKTEQQWLKESLEEKRTAARQLEEEIENLIAAQKKEDINPAESSDFSEKQGKLNWPVNEGVIVNSFGEHRHAVLENVTIKNNGIDIQLSEGSDVFCVHPGEVSTVVGIPGLNKAVIVRHGKFLTVYGNLVDVYVSKGDIVNAGEKIGEVFEESSEMQEILHFEIWEENTKLDPEQWLLQ